MQEAGKEKLYQQLKDAVVAIKKLKADLKEERAKKKEPIAVIGMAMRLPGGVNSAKKFWDLLTEGRDAVTDIPSSRFDAAKYYDADYSTPGKMVVKQGGFLDQIDQFDGSFFDISYAELESMDPQQRLLLEVAHEATENAGIPVKSLFGSKTGVFIGVTNIDYQKRHFRSGDLTLINPYSYTGATVCSNSGRISYLMGLEGPSVSIDTACSSSLVTTHLAVQSLRNGECDMAFTGAANLIIDPEFTIYFSHLNALSADSRCKSFSNEANGFIRSEGAGILLLKRLSDAQKDGDHILAVIEGTAVNQDGRSNGFTAPNVQAQERLLREALNNAGLKAEQVGYIEAHGTGTKIGDPIEMEAISSVYSSAKTKENPLIVGSVKSNIGHTEGAAGVAGSIKSILMLQHGEIPKNLHFKTPNELIDWENTPVKIPTEKMELDTEHRHIGVSGFGVTGTNAHVILGAAPESETPKDVALRTDVFILPLSAKSEEALKALASLYADFIQNSGEQLEDICAMTALRRSRYDLTEVFVANTQESLVEKLQDFAELNDEEQKTFDSEDPIKVVLVCPGQGAQWIGMARQLYDAEPVFRKSLDDSATSFSKYVDWNLIDELNGHRYEELDIIQPVLVAIEIALGELWKSKGIIPDIVVGHSMGEVAAAYLAENITLDEAAKIICTRSKLMKQTSGQGAMMVTDLNLQEAENKIADKTDRLAIAVQNSLNSTVISGQPEAIDSLLAELDAEGRFCRKIKVDVASHSPQMDVVLPDLKQALENLQAKNSNITFYSTALSQIVKGENLDADYWVKNLRNTVKFGEVVRAILGKDKAVFIELSPHPVLTNAIQENIESVQKHGIAIPSLYREKDELESFYKAFGKYFESGLEVDWKNIYPDIRQFIILPNYPWQRERFWFDEPAKLEQSTIDIIPATVVENTEIETGKL
ncbi:MAG: type I polyketide synthase [Chitinophagales bacterium]|nr:type I polyketide synthase [Chitinophagales bacterium]